MRLHHRIVIPLAMVALVATLATSYVAMTVTARASEARLETQIRDAAMLVSQSNFALNPTILRSVKAIAAADVVTYDASGEILASTIDSTAAASRVRAVTAAGPARGNASAMAEVHRVACGGQDCYVAYRPVAARPDTIVAIVAEGAPLAQATRAVTRTILIAALLSLFAMIVVSQIVARRVTGPIEDLARFAQAVKPGTDLRARTGDDEVGRLGRAFNGMLDRLAESQQARVRSEKLALAGLIAARVAHDVRNPLSSIKMQTQLLRARLQFHRDGDTREIVDAVLHDIAQVELVVSDLLELARPGELSRKPASLNTIVREALEQVRLQLTHRRIAVMPRLEAQLPDIPLDVGRFRQVLLNVINNAADAMTNGGTLSIATHASPDRSTIELDVCDDGTGIDPAMLDQVFDPFVSTKRDGVGLGLVNAKAVAK